MIGSSPGRCCRYFRNWRTDLHRRSTSRPIASWRSCLAVPARPRARSRSARAWRRVPAGDVVVDRREQARNLNRPDRHRRHAVDQVAVVYATSCAWRVRTRTLLARITTISVKVSSCTTSQMHSREATADPASRAAVCPSRWRARLASGVRGRSPCVAHATRDRQREGRPLTRRRATRVFTLKRTAARARRARAHRCDNVASLARVTRSNAHPARSTPG